MNIEKEHTESGDWYIYIIKCVDGSLYTGITTDVVRRLAEHQSGKGGSKYLRGRIPLVIALQKKVGDKSLALKIENRIKKLSKNAKEELIHSGLEVDALLKRPGCNT